MPTAQDIVLRALKTCGAVGQGETPSTADLQDALDALNDLLGEWSAKRWLMFQLLDVTCVGNGTNAYTIGPGQDFDTPRADRIESAFVRLLGQPQQNQIDFPLDVIPSREQWNLVGFKGLQSFPAAVFLDSGYPTGTVYAWPAPTNAYQLHLSVKAQLAQLASLSAAVSLPDPYMSALRWNLAANLCPIFGLPLRVDIAARATASLAAVRGANFQLGKMRLPAGLPARHIGGAWWWGGAAAQGGGGVVQRYNADGTPAQDALGNPVFDPT